MACNLAIAILINYDPPPSSDGRVNATCKNISTLKFCSWFDLPALERNDLSLLIFELHCAEM